MVALLTEYLQQVASMPVLPWLAPDAQVQSWNNDFTGVAEPEAELQRIVQAFVRASTHVHAPRSMSHQVAAPLPAAAWCHAAAALTNNSTAVYEMSPAATAMERVVVRWMCRQLGYSEAAEGLLTAGGSLGNLTALLAARQQRAGFDVWREGAHAGPPLAIITSQATHYCVRRAANIMGLGDAGTLLASTDSAYRIDVRAVKALYQAATQRGVRVFAVAASACSTAVGAYDSLPALADFCAEHDVWLHVDGAHGASACLSPKYRDLLRGIELADSVVWDAHKMLMVPSLVTGVLFRDREPSYETFAQQATYLLGQDARDEWFNMSHRTVECTRPALALPLYTLLASYGSAMFGDHVTRTYDLAQKFAQLLEAAHDFEMAVQPQANIVCFRHLRSGVQDGNGASDHPARQG